MEGRWEGNREGSREEKFDHAILCEEEKLFPIRGKKKKSYLS